MSCGTKTSRKTFQNIKIRCLETSRINTNDFWKNIVLNVLELFMMFSWFWDPPPSPISPTPPGHHPQAEMTIVEREASRKTLQNIKIRCLETSRINTNDFWKTIYFDVLDIFSDFFHDFGHPLPLPNIPPSGRQSGVQTNFPHNLELGFLFRWTGSPSSEGVRNFCDMF